MDTNDGPVVTTEQQEEMTDELCRGLLSDFLGKLADVLVQPYLTDEAKQVMFGVYGKCRAARYQLGPSEVKPDESFPAVPAGFTEKA